MITSSAGYPLDTTFTKRERNDGSCFIVKSGGTIIVAASMSGGIGSPEFTSLFERHPDIEDFMLGMSPEYFVMDQWQLEMLAKVLRKAEVKVVTDGLSAETINKLYVTQRVLNWPCRKQWQNMVKTHRSR